MLNKFREGLQTFSTLFLALYTMIILASCEDSHSLSLATKFISKKHFAILGPISDANVSIKDADSGKLLFLTKTKAYANTLDTGSFEVDFAESLELGMWISTEITSGEDIDPDDDGNITSSFLPLRGVMRAYCKRSDFNDSSVIINIFTTVGAEFYLKEGIEQGLDKEEYLNTFAKTIFIKSIDAKEGIDYRDLIAYVPNKTPNDSFVSPTLYQNLLLYGVMDAVRSGTNVTALLYSDEDGDILTLWEELLHDTSPILADTDGDAIDDKQEILQGTNPILKDSDYDGIEDNDEIVLYHTSPIKSDSDDDFIPDGVEIASATSPLDGDENKNNIADGLDGDPFFKYQWHIKSLGTVIDNTVDIATIIGNDLNIMDVYHYVLGNASGINTVIQVIDTGVELLHEDIDVDLATSYNAVTGSNDPTSTIRVSNSDPVSPVEIGHGSAVAGIAAARTNNEFGVRGIVPRASIAGSNWLEDQTLGELERVWYSQINDARIVVSNNSWGAYYLKDTSYERLLAIATKELRNGKGRIFTFAAGNSREEYGNANLSYVTSNPYVISVASLNHKDIFATYSTPGSCILVSAYGGEHYYTAPTIMSTLLMGKSYFESELNDQKGAITVDDDLQKNYTYAMNGTSAATPMVSGAIALVVDACPNLSWRDVKWLIANTSTKIDQENPSWIKNSAGLTHSIDYGYGKINPLQMIEKCRSKYFQPLPEMQYAQKSHLDLNTLIPDTNTTVSEKIELSENLKIEWVGLSIDTNHPFAGDLEISLISPSGTRTSLIKPNEMNFAGYQDGFRLSSVAFVDENSLGMWNVEITDRLEDDAGTLKSLKLEVYGYKK